MPRTTLTGADPEPLRALLRQRGVALLGQGVPSDRVLVLAPARSREAWRDEVEAAGLVTGALRVTTPAAWIKQELRLWWPLVEPELGPGPAREVPLFAEIDVAQYLVVRATAAFRQRTACFEDAATPPHLQNVALLDSLARAAEHRLWVSPGAPPEDPGAADDPVTPLPAPLAGLLAAVRQRLLGASGGVQPEAGFVDASWQCLWRYVALLAHHRILDHGLQAWAYGRLLDQPAYRAALAARLDHLLIEDLDEQPPLVLDLVAAIGATADATWTLTTPAGPGGLLEYKGADPRGALDLASDSEVVPHNPSWDGGFGAVGRALHDALVRPAGAPPPAPVPGKLAEAHLKLDLPDHDALLDEAARRIRRLLASGVPADQVALVAPTLDPMLIWGLRERLADTAPLYVAAGTNRLVDYRPVRCLLTLARLCHPAWGVAIARHELLELVEVATGEDALALSPVLAAAPDGTLPEAEAAVALPAGARAGLDRLCTWVAAHRTDPSPAVALDRFLEEAFAACWAVFRPEPLGDPREAEAWQREVSQIGQLVDTCRKFTEVVVPLDPDPDPAVVARRFLGFLYGGTIAERPFFQREPHRHAVKLATAQKFAEVEPPVQHQIWLDASSDRWWKSDRRELTNPRVLSRHWPAGAAYDAEQDDADMDGKLARVLYALAQKATEGLQVLGALVDAEGRDQTGRLPYLLDQVVGLSAEAVPV